MHFLLFFLVILCCRLSDALTSTKINYLPNGQVGGYELIINNTVEPTIQYPLPRDRVSKIVKHTSNIGSTFTRVDEQVIGENSYLNVHSILQQYRQQPKQIVKKKYPVKTVLMVPSVRYVNGVPENVTLRFAQIGPYAALIVPVNKSEISAGSEVTVPPEIRDSIKTYVEVQELQTPPPESLAQSSQKIKTGYAYAPPTYESPSTVSPSTNANVNLPSLAQSSQKTKTGYAYAPPTYKNPSTLSPFTTPNENLAYRTQSSQKIKTGYAYVPATYKNPPSSVSPFTAPSLNSQQPSKTGNYIYPGATTPSKPTSETPGTGNYNKNAFVVRILNPANGDPNSKESGNKYQEFLVPARPDQLEPERNDKIVANPFRYSGSSGPSPSQFGEVYSKDNPSTASGTLSEYRGSTSDEPSTDQLPESATDVRDKHQEFLAPARPDQLEPERNDKIIANRFRYSGSSGPSPSQFEEVYSKDNPSTASDTSNEYRPSTSDASSTDQLPESATDVRDEHQQFLAPARPDQLEPERNDKIITNQVRYSGSSGPSPSQFGEVYSKDNPSTASATLSEYRGSTSDASSTDQLAESATDVRDKHQELLGPARTDQLEPERNDKIIANPFRYSGSSSPSPSQFEEVYSKDNPSTASDTLSEYRGSTSDMPSTDQLPESTTDGKDRAATTIDEKTGTYRVTPDSGSPGTGKKVDGEKESENEHFQSGWSLVETKAPELGYNPFGGPPPGQPEFSDVSPDSDLTKFQSQQSESETNKNKHLTESLRSDSEKFSTTKQPSDKQTFEISEGQTSGLRASFSAPVDPQFKSFGPSRPEQTGSTQLLFDRDFKIRGPANSAYTLKPEVATQQFQVTSDEKEVQVPNKGSNVVPESVIESHETRDETISQLSDVKPAEGAVESAQTSSDRFREKNLEQLSNPAPGSSSAETKSAQFQGTLSENLGRISNEGSVTTDSKEQFGRFEDAKPGFEQFPYDGPGSAGQFRGDTVKSEMPSSGIANSVQRFGGNADNTAQNNRNAPAATAASSAEQFNRIQDTSSAKLAQTYGLAVDSNLQGPSGQFQGSTGQNLEQFKEGSPITVSNSGQQFKPFQGTSAQNFGPISSDSLATAGLSAAELNQIQDTIKQTLDHISLGESASVAMDLAQQLEKSQKDGQGFSAGHRNIALTTADGTGKLPFIHSEKFKTFIQNPSLTSQLEFLSPDGQTAAILTSTGTSAKVELPSRAPLKGQIGDNIYIPKTVVPLPSRGGTPFEYRGRETIWNSLYNQQRTAIPSARHHYDSVDSLNNVQNRLIWNSINLGNQQQSDIYDKIYKEIKPVSNFEFDSAAAAAAAAAAVAADNEHFNRFDATEKLETKPFLVSDTAGINQQLDSSQQGLRNPVWITGTRRPISVQPISVGPEIGEAPASASATANVNNQILTGLYPGGLSFERKDQKAHENVINEQTKEVLTGFDERFGSQPIPSQSGQYEGEGRARENLYSQFVKDDSSSEKAAAAEAASRAGAANIATNRNQQRWRNPINGGSSFEYRDQGGKKNILDESKKESSAQLTDHLPTLTRFQFPEDERKFEEGQFSPQLPKDITPSGNLNYGAPNLVGKSDVYSALAPNVRPNAELLPSPNGHTVNIHMPETTARKSLQQGGIPQYVIDEESKASIPITLQHGVPVTLHDRYASAYGRYVTPVVSRYNEDAGVRVVASQPAPIAGPHTERLLKTLNGLFTQPTRQLP